MEHLPETFLVWLTQYGSLALFVLLALGIIALPVPEETLMIVAGAFINSGELYLVPTVLAAYGGSICGITLSYLFGYLSDIYIIEKYGPRIGLTETRMNQLHQWFERFGRWPLFFGYFIPGIRHFTGLSAGISQLHYRDFALYAYTGAIVWGSTFLSIGYFFGKYWINIVEHIEGYWNEILIGVALIAFIGFLYYRFKKSRQS